MNKKKIALLTIWSIISICGAIAIIFYTEALFLFSIAAVVVWGLFVSTVNATTLAYTTTNSKKLYLIPAISVALVAPILLGVNFIFDRSQIFQKDVGYATISNLYLFAITLVPILIFTYFISQSIRKQSLSKLKLFLTTGYVLTFLLLAVSPIIGSEQSNFTFFYFKKPLYLMEINSFENFDIGQHIEPKFAKDIEFICVINRFPDEFVFVSKNGFITSNGFHYKEDGGSKISFGGRIIKRFDNNWSYVALETCDRKSFG